MDMTRGERTLTVSTPVASESKRGENPGNTIGHKVKQQKGNARYSNGPIVSRWRISDDPARRITA